MGASLASQRGSNQPSLTLYSSLAMQLVSSWHSSLMHSSCCLWGSMLGTTTHFPCRPVLQPSGSLNPKRVCTEGCSGANSAISKCNPWEHLQCSLLHMAAILWSMYSKRNRLHSWFWAVLQPKFSLHNSFKNSWLWKSSWLPSLSSQSSGKIPLPVLLVWKNSHSVGYLTLPSSNKWWTF